MTLTLRPLNGCYTCDHRWHPRGHDQSTRCPRCHNTTVASANRSPMHLFTNWAQGLASAGGVVYLMVASVGVVVHTADAWVSDKPGSPVVHGVVTVADHTVKASVFSVKLTGVMADNVINGKSTVTKNWL